MNANPDVPLMQRHDQAKQKALKAQEDQRLRQKGFQETAVGFTFPGVSTDEVTKAVENRKENFEPELPQVTATYIDFEGKFSIVFEDDLMMPDSIDTKLWDELFEI